MPDVALTINSKRYAGWTAVSVQRGIEQISGIFDLSVSERWHGQETPWPIKPGDACTLSVDGTVLITGHVDDVSPHFDAGNHRLRIYGRDATGDLVDCSAANKPGRWENRTLTQIAVDICKPFGISVKAVTGVGAAFRSFALQPGETAFEAIERLCRQRGVLPVSDGLGGLLITGPGTAHVPVRLVQGQNILEAQSVLSWRDRHSIYVVKGCDSGMDESTPDQNSGPMGMASDPNVNRYRPLIVIAEDAADSDKLTTRARWEAAVRRGRSARAVVSVQGWSHPDGLWAPNKRVKVQSQWLRLDSDLLITTVTFVRDQSGTHTDLELCAPEALTPRVIAEEEDVL